jgi:hypothetical protein
MELVQLNQEVSVETSYEHSNEFPSSVTGEEIYDQLSDY